MKCYFRPIFQFFFEVQNELFKFAKKYEKKISNIIVYKYMYVSRRSRT